MVGWGGQAPTSERRFGAAEVVAIRSGWRVDRWETTSELVAERPAVMIRDPHAGGDTLTCRTASSE